MRMKTKTAVNVGLIGVIVLGWAFILAQHYTDTVVFVTADPCDVLSRTSLLDPNGGLFTIIRNEPNRTDVRWESINIYMKDRCRVKMRDNSKSTEVMGELPGGKTYPVVIDSGNSHYAGVMDTVAADAHLQVYPLQPSSGLFAGLCYIPELKMGGLLIKGLGCDLWTAHYERRVLGRTTWKEQNINFGLRLMKRFSYILIDGARGEVEFSGRSLFEPNDPENWFSYHTTIESDRAGDRLFVNIPIAGFTRPVAIDTACGPGLVMTEKVWEDVLPNVRPVGEKPDSLATPMAGHVPCRKITVAALPVGDMTIANAEVCIMEKNNPYGPDDFTLGIGYFKGTTLVLDFNGGLLWIRRTPLKGEH